MTWLNFDDARAQVESAGLLLDDRGLEVDSKRPVRVRVADGGRERRGWYWLSTWEHKSGLYISGAYGIYQGNDPGKQTIAIRLDGKAIEQSKEERAAIRRRNAERQQQVAAEAAAIATRAARTAARVWAQYLPTGTSDYLVRKGVQAHGLRFDPNGAGTVAVPILRDAQVVGLQIIRGKSRARGKLEKEYFPAGIDKRGGHHQLGSLVGAAAVILAEGYATAASIYEALGQAVPVIVCFDAGGLDPVAAEIHRRYRRAHIIVAADDDHVQTCAACGVPVDLDQHPDTCDTCGQPHRKRNAGCEAARLVAHAVGGSWCKPAFAPRPAEGTLRKGERTDYNDLHLTEGLHVVRAQIEAHILAVGVSAQGARLPAHPGAGDAHAAGGGDGDGSLPRMIGLADALERFSLIYAGKATLFDHQEHCLVPKQDVLDILPDHAWREFKRAGGLRLVRLAEVGFDPAGTDPTIRCNLWGGWPTVPKAGKCDALLSLLEHLCAHEQNARDLYQWVLRWLAYPLQHPGAKMRTALVVHGPQGVGKNLFFEAYMAIYGHYGRIIDQSSLEDKFNDWASRKLFLIGDEVVSRQELYHVKNKLKSFITGEWLRINPKNVSPHDERNHVNMVFLSNEKKPLEIEQDDRRYVVIWTPEKLASYHYGEVREEIKNGGIAALHQYLLDLDLGDFDMYAEAPRTDAKRDLLELGLESTERFLRDWQIGDINARVEAGEPTVLPFCPCSTADLYGQYRRWCTAEGVTRPREQAHFLGHIAKLDRWSRGHKDIHGGASMTGPTRRARMVVPSDAALQAAMVRPGAADWRRRDGETQAQWLTRCFFAFREAVRDYQ